MPPKGGACVRNKWGAGTTCEKVPDTEATKEMKSSLAKMMAEREAQDTMWNPTPEKKSPPKTL
jgi:hypothetical protein